MDPIVKKKKLPPGAAQALAGVPENKAMVPVPGTRTVNPDPAGARPTVLGRTTGPGAAVRPVPAVAPPLTEGLPNYRTGAPQGQPQFQQTPTPVNPQVRTAAQTLGTAPEPPAASVLGKAANSGRVMPAKLPGAARTVGGLAALAEGANVVQTIRDPKASAFDVAEQGFRGVARTTAGAAGAALGSPFGGPVGATAGGLAGYEAADRVIDLGTGDREMQYSPVAQKMSDLGISPMLIPGMREAEILRNLFSPKTEQPSAPATKPVASTPMAPDIGKMGDQSEVIGYFNGKPITRDQSNLLASQVSSIPASPQTASQKLAAPNISFDADYSGRRGIEKTIDDQLKAIGIDPKIPGKRKLLAELLGLKTQLYQGNAKNEQERGIAQANLEAGTAAEQLGSTTQLRIADQNAKGKSQSPIVGADGNLYTLADNKLTPVTDKDGNPAKAPQGGNEEAQKLYGDLLKQLLPEGAKKEDLQAAEELLSQIPMLQGVAGQGSVQWTGKLSPDGKKIYRDGTGKKFTE